MRNTVTKSNHSGISLITVIVTIVVIIILAGVVLYSQFYTVNSATFAKFVQEFEEVRDSVETVRLGNTKESIANIDDGFEKVTVSGDIPYSFMSIGNGKEQAYLVDLNLIGCDALTTGRDYTKFLSLAEEDRIIHFGKDDVYVYDSRGRLFYARGVNNDGTIMYEGISSNSNSNIKIIDVSQTINAEKTKVKITVKIKSDKEIASVMIGGKIATKVEGTEDMFEIEVTQNGVYEIVAKDVDGKTARGNVNVTGIGSNEKPVVTARVKNSLREEEGVYIINEQVAKLELTSETATTLYISTERGNPESITDWLAFSSNVEKYFNDTGDKTLYIYVKDENGNWNEPVCEVKIRIVLDETPPTTPQVDIKDGEINIYRDPDVPIEAWARYKDFAKYKDIIIEYPEDMQGDGYKSTYRLKTGLGLKWNEAKTQKVTVRVTKNNTTVEAKLGYDTIFNSKDIASKEFLVKGIDLNPPTITKLEIQGEYIVGEAVEEETEEESGMPDAKYLIMMNSVDFNIVSVGNYTWTSEPTMKITESGKYYLYARDNVGNVAVKSIYAEAPDGTPPVIDSITQKAVEDDVIIRIIAHDDVGIVKYQIVKDSEELPTTWIDVDETKRLVKEGTISEDGNYTIWVKDSSGNVAKKTVEIITNKYPVLDDYPKDVKLLEGASADFNVVISKAGYPDIYDYKWLVSKNNGATWEEITDSTSPTYRTEALSITENGYLYKCVVTNERGSVESRVAKLEVIRITNEKPSIEVTQQTETVLGGIIINDGAKTTTSNLLTIKVVALNASEVNISESETPTGTWVRYSDTLQYTLQNTTAGMKKIYVRVKDSQGNIINEVAIEQIEKQ